MEESAELTALADLLSGLVTAVSEIPTEYLGVAVTPSAGGRVTVDVAGSLWNCLDLPNTPAALSDTLMVTETGNDHMVTQNVTQTKNPPTGPPNITVNQDLTTVNTVSSSGQYSWTDGTQMGTYVNELSAVTRSLAADLNQLRVDCQAMAADVNTLRTDVMSIGNTLNSLLALLRTRGIFL